MHEPQLTASRRPVSLIGMPGSGKSSVGKEVAKRLGRRFVDSDKVIEAHVGCTIAQLFERDGEEAFRDLEATVLADLVQDESSVIATGGGAVLRSSNRDLLRARSACVFLSATPGFLWRRLRRDRRRPLLQVAEPQVRLQQLFVEREPLYRETASIVIDVERLSLDDVAGIVVGRLAPAVQGP
ncbi:MAG: shikimate kinase [Caldimonas sp.]